MTEPKVRRPKAGNPNILDISIKPGDSERARRIGRLGGLGNKGSEKARLAGRLRWLKRKGLTNETCKTLHEMMTSNELSALEILSFINSIKDEGGSLTARIELSKVLIDWHKMHHGMKVRNENLNLNVNVPFEEWERRLMGDPQ